MKKVVVEYGTAGKIAKAMNCTLEMVSKALNYKKDSQLARKIRYVAKTQFGGIEIGE